MQQMPQQMTLNLAALKSELVRRLDDDLPLREFGELYMEYVLATCNGNKVKAAKILGVDRRTIYRIIARKESRGIPSFGGSDF